jgi:hypothetical protein
MAQSPLATKSQMAKTEPEIIGYFSVRRKPDKSKLAVLQDLYQQMLAEEKRAGET